MSDEQEAYEHTAGPMISVDPAVATVRFKEAGIDFRGGGAGATIFAPANSATASRCRPASTTAPTPLSVSMCSRFGLRCERPWGSHMAMLIYNPAETPADLVLDIPAEARPGERFHAWSFWDREYLGASDATRVFKAMGVRESRLLRLTPPAADKRPVIVGSDLHITMGAAEFACVRATGATLDIELAAAGATNGSIFFHGAGNWTLKEFHGMAQATLTRAAPEVWCVEIEGRNRGEEQGLSLAAGIV